MYVKYGSAPTTSSFDQRPYLPGNNELVSVNNPTAGDFLKVRFSDAAGYMKETDNDAVMERVDECGQVIGFSIMQVCKLSRQKPLVAELLPSLNRINADGKEFNHG